MKKWFVLAGSIGLFVAFGFIGSKFWEKTPEQIGDEQRKLAISEVKTDLKKINNLPLIDPELIENMGEINKHRSMPVFEFKEVKLNGKKLELSNTMEGVYYTVVKESNPFTSLQYDPDGHLSCVSFEKGISLPRRILSYCKTFGSDKSFKLSKLYIQVDSKHSWYLEGDGRLNSADYTVGD